MLNLFIIVTIIIIILIVVISILIIIIFILFVFYCLFYVAFGRIKITRYRSFLVSENSKRVINYSFVQADNRCVTSVADTKQFLLSSVNQSTTVYLFCRV